MAYQTTKINLVNQNRHCERMRSNPEPISSSKTGLLTSFFQKFLAMTAAVRESNFLKINKLFVVLFIASVSSATAQTPPAAPEQPQVTTASFGDWVLRCIATQQPAKGKTCEIAQTLQIQGQNAPFAQFAFTKVEGNDKWKLVTVFPPNIALPSSVKLKTSETAKEVDINWVRCIPAACVAEAFLETALVTEIRANPTASTILMTDSTRKQITSPIRFKGLAQAMDAYAAAAK